MAQAKQQKTTSKEFKREPYKRNELSRTTSTAPAWAWGCELCEYGTVKGTTNEYCTCQAGQARARWASGNMAPLEDEIRVPTFNAAYGGGA